MSICLGALCDILDFNANLAEDEEFDGNINKFSFRAYNNLVVDVTDGNSYYKIENVITIALEHFDALNYALYENFVNYVKSNPSRLEYKMRSSDLSYENSDLDEPFEI